MPRDRKVAFGLLTMCLFVLPMTLTVYSADDKAVATSGPRYSAWSTPVSVAPVSADGVNTALQEFPNGISRDGLSLYFQRNHGATSTREDLYVVHRPDLESDWGVPVKLPHTINSTSNERGAFVSSDGHWLFFASDRPGGIGSTDLYVSWRTHVHNDGDWQPAVNLTAVNSVGFDSGPTLFEDEESQTIQLYFNSAPFAGGLQAVADIYMSTLGPDGFGPPTPVVELNSPVQEGRPYLRRDGREIYMQSNRTGPVAIWVATRASTSESWSAPVLAIHPAVMNDPAVLSITTPVLSWDSRTLFVGVGPAGNIFVSSREKVKGTK